MPKTPKKNLDTRKQKVMHPAPASRNVVSTGEPARRIRVTQKKTSEPSTPGHASYTDLYERIFNSIPLPVFVKDRQHRWILINDSLCELQETNRESLLYSTDFDLFPKEQAEELYQLEEEIFKTREPFFVEEYTTRNGQDSYVLIKKTVVTDRNNNDYIVGGCIDITQRKKIELAILESERRFRSLVQHSPDIIMILEKDATIRYVTPSFSRIMGYADREIQGAAIYRFIHFEDVFSVQQKVQELLKFGGGGGKITFKGRREDGEMVILNATITNLLNDTAVQGLVINASDITLQTMQANEIKRINEFLEKDNIELRAELKNEVKARYDLKALDFDEFHKVYPDEDSCYQHLAGIKWKGEYHCARCRNTKYSKGKFPYSRRCTLCGFDESPLKGTIFENQKFSIIKGFYMAFLIAGQLKISSQQLSNMVNLRKDTCAVFKRNFLNIYKSQRRNSQSPHQWESLIFLKKKNAATKK